jgi:hypothetical protein
VAEATRGGCDDALGRVHGQSVPAVVEAAWMLERTAPGEIPLNGPVSGKAVSPANLCPIQCGGAATHSRPRTIILHNESGQCKRFLSDLPP